MIVLNPNLMSPLVSEPLPTASRACARAPGAGPAARHAADRGGSHVRRRAPRASRRVASGMFGAGRKEATSRRLLVRGGNCSELPRGRLSSADPTGRMRPMGIKAACPADIPGNLSLFRRRSERGGVSRLVLIDGNALARRKRLLV